MKRVPKVQLTAPPRIWLQVSDDSGDRDEPFPSTLLGYEITWCQDSVLECEVPYVRADLLQSAREALQQLLDRGIADAGTMAKAKAALEALP